MSLIVAAGHAREPGAHPQWWPGERPQRAFFQTGNEHGDLFGKKQAAQSDPRQNEVDTRFGHRVVVFAGSRPGADKSRLDRFGLGHLEPMRPGCCRAAEMMFAERRSFGVDDADRPRRAGHPRVAGVRLESARHRHDRLREYRSIDRFVSRNGRSRSKH